MEEKHEVLLTAIRSVAFDPEGATFTFEQRLARENGWSRAYTKRAIEEYHRFLFLAAEAGHPVSPSDVVDQVWHLHLLYTRSYWNELCRTVLPRPLHHEPSAGGTAETAKFEDWSAKTKASYRKFFGEDAPAQFWNSVEHGTFRRVDLSRNFVLAKPAGWAGVATVILMLFLVALAAGCGSSTSYNGGAMHGDSLSPLNLSGPAFLAFFGVASVVGFAAAAIVRMMGKGADDGSALPAKLPDDEIAYLHGGPALAVNVAVMRLVQRGIVKLTATPGLKLLMKQATIETPLDSVILEGLSENSETPLTAIRRRASDAVEAIAMKLEDRNLVLNSTSATRLRSLSVTIALAAPAIGLLKIFVGLSRGRPVGFLLLGMIVVTLLAFILFARAPRRTRKGDRMLRSLQRNKEIYGIESIAANLAVFGLGSLASTEYSDHRSRLAKGEGTDGGSWTFHSCGSSCGSSCGGGGCGGGGCGGCGS